MSAIFGIFRMDGARPKNSDLQRMALSMRQRGPDAVRIWFGDGVGLGHCMLWATPESIHEAPPVISPDRKRVLCADVRLDNRDHLLGILRPLLQCPQKPAAEIGDNELILAAYQRWGADCARHLLGDFAFTLWDQTKQVMLCARDHYGSKPFCYFRSNRIFVFASEIKALLEIADVPVRVNEPRIADFLVAELEGIDKTSTFYRDIFRLPPATTMVVAPNQTRQTRYWKPEPGKEPTPRTEAECTEAFFDVFSQAVNCRLRSYKPPACTLSGGIDSSAVVAVARDLRAAQGLEDLHTVSAVSETAETCIESQAILAVINQGNLIPHLITPSGLRRFQAKMEDMITCCDDIFSLPGIGVPLATYCTARNAGVNVVLDGIDGDLVTSYGSHYLAYLLKARQWRVALGEAMSHSRNYYRNTISPLSLLMRNARTAFIPHGLRKLLHKTRARQRLKESLGTSIINRNFAREMDLPARLELLYEHLRTPLPKSLAESQASTLEQGFITVALERYDRQASSQSIEARHPFFDIRLVQFCLALPWQQRVHNGYPKAILRDAMKNRLPESVRWRVGGWEHLANIFNPQWEEMQWTSLKSAVADQREVLNRYIDPDMLGTILRASSYLDSRADLRAQLLQAGTLARWLGALPKRV